MTMTRISVARVVERRLRRLDLDLGDDIRRLRLEAGLSLTDVAAFAGIHRSHLARIEAGRARASIEVLTAIGVVLGADLGLRYFSGAGPRLHDRHQAPMIEALLKAIHARWRVGLEVGTAARGRGVADLTLEDRTTPTLVVGEVESQLPRLEQQLRWISEKASAIAERQRIEQPERVPATVSRLLILRSTVQTREVARSFEATLRTAYPARTNDVVAALTTPDAAWPGAGIVWMRLERGAATMLAYPPRGVRAGR